MQLTFEFGMEGPEPAEEACCPPAMEEQELSSSQESVASQLPLQADIVLAGFRDCSEEAIRYLIDVEHMSENDPLVVGLKQHLWRRQQQINFEQIIFDLINQRDLFSEDGDACVVPQHTPEHEGGIDTEANDSGNASMLGTLPNESSNTSMLDHAEPHSMDESHTETHPNNDSHWEVLQSDESLISLDSANISSEDYSEPMLTLAMLAQNNPAIASITEEIISLLDEEQAFDSVAVDSIGTESEMESESIANVEQ